MPYKNKLRNNLLPLFVSLGVVVGILIGSFFASRYSGRRLSIINTSSNKINDLFHLIDDEYVDSVNMPDLVERSLPEILKQLDPHSTYISAKDVDGSMQELRGSFSGIGVQFTIFRDTVRIIRVIRGGPSESVGLHAGDRIVKVDDKPFTGSVVTNEETMKRLKGPTNSRVKLEVLRAGEKSNRVFSIVRGDVPVNSITASYMLNDSIGYIRIASFGETTYPEFLAALAKLSQHSFGGLVLDLRGNLGGYMDPAVQIAREFLPKGSMIVYTEGRKSPKQPYMSDGKGSYPDIPLVLLVDETSASASEILAGAIQDNDRGTIIGRRTFGKGLVQVPIQFDDGSMLRLTKARYYTPSGRCVQKPYTPGDEEEYEADLMMRAAHGEYQSSDSIKTSGKEYKTRLGRTVFGGGGIIPDVFIAEDTTNITSYFKECYVKGLIFQYAYVYADAHRAQLEKCSGHDEMVAWLTRQDLLSGFSDFAEQAGVRRRPLLMQKSAVLFNQYIISNILSDMLDTEAQVRFVNDTDPTVHAALGVMRSGKAFPTVEKPARAQQSAAVTPVSPLFRALLMQQAAARACFSAPLARLMPLALCDEKVFHVCPTSKPSAR